MCSKMVHFISLWGTSQGGRHFNHVGIGGHLFEGEKLGQLFLMNGRIDLIFF